MSKLPMCKNCNSCIRNEDLGRYKKANIYDTALICKIMNKLVDSIFICHQYREK